MTDTAGQDPTVETTLNGMGWCTEVPSRLNLSFIDFAASVKCPVLEIGGGMGVVARAALRNGAEIFFNDLAAGHIERFTSRANDEGLTNYRVVLGRFPRIDVPSESVAAVHASNVIHFLTPEELNEGLQQVVRWLR